MATTIKQAVAIGIEARRLDKLASALNELLADEFMLYVKARNFHWNVVGPDFAELHAFFEKRYEEQNDIVDAVAERVRALGHPAVATMSGYLRGTTLKETPENLDDRAMLQALVYDLEAVCRSIRPKLELAQSSRDEGTVNLLGGLLERHEKAAWMARSYLE